MKITTGRIGCAILALYGLSLLGGDPEGAELSRQNESTRDLVQQSRHQERDALRRSSIALQRFRRGCQPVEDKSTGLEALHSENTQFLDRQTGFAFPAEIEICNGRGWTAVTDENGYATDIAIATPQDSNSNQIPDITEAQEIFKQL